MRRIAILFFCFLCGGFGLRAAEGEEDQFKAAAAAFADRFYERAEQQLGDFLTKYPSSTNAPRAILMQAQARVFQRKFDVAIDLLKKNNQRSGALRDQYVFWEGEAHYQQGEYPPAIELYQKVISDFPQSPMRLEAAFAQANSYFKMREYQKVIDLLRSPEADFQKLSKATPASPYVLRGTLLLAEALFASAQSTEALAVAAAAAGVTNRADLDWEKHQLLARIEFAGQKPENAFPHISDAIAAAQLAQKPALQAQSINLEADLYKKLGQTDKAIASYEKILSLDNLGIEQKRLALLKELELFATTSRVTNAIVRLESYLTVNTNEPAADLLRVKAGELWLDQFRAIAGTSTNLTPPQKSDATNAMVQARAHLNSVITQFTNSAHLGKAWLNLGWTYWEEGSAFQDMGKIQESENTFQTAMRKLTRSDDQAVARFKVADAQYASGQYASAVSNYLAVIELYADLPQVKNSLFDRTYRKLVRASLDLKNFEQAANYVNVFRNEFPTSPLMEETVYFYGQALALAGRKAEARKVFDDFLKTFPNSPLCPDVQFAEARTFSAEGEWNLALTKEEQWLAIFTNHPLRPDVEFQRASLYDKAGNASNAFQLFTNFVAQFPLHPLAPAAQNWVGDYYYNQEEWPLAEQNYQKVFQNTNWHSSPFYYESRLMAAKTAFFRQDYSGAQSYLMSIIKEEAGSPPDLRCQAWFELGDVFIEQPITGSTNRLNNYVEAAKVYDLITRQFTNRFTPMAWGKKGDCHMQLFPTYAQSFTNALEAYEKVAQTATDETPVSVLNQAEYGMGLLFEKAAELKSGAERDALLKKALGQYLNVVYGTNLKGKQPSPLYLKLAGRDAGRLAENLGESSAALELYKRLLKELPSMKKTWESRIAALQQKLVSN